MTADHFRRGQIAALVALAWPAVALANHEPKKIETVVISGGRPTTLPIQIPTTIEGITGAQVEKTFGLAARNIPNVDVLPTVGLNVYDVLRREKLVLTREAVEAIQARLTEKEAA